MLIFVILCDFFVFGDRIVKVCSSKLQIGPKWTKNYVTDINFVLHFIFFVFFFTICSVGHKQKYLNISEKNFESLWTKIEGYKKIPARSVHLDRLKSPYIGIYIENGLFDALKKKFQTPRGDFFIAFNFCPNALKNFFWDV